MDPALSDRLCKILIADDNLINRQYLTGLLRQWGIEYDVAVDGPDACARLLISKYDLLLLDIMMPGLDGYQVAEQVRANPHHINHHIPIIALTAATLTHERKMALDCGMNAYLSKPFVPEELLELIKRYLSVADTLASEEETFHFSDNLDRDYLEDFYQGDVDRAIALFEIFLRMIDGEINSLMHHYVVGDWKAFSSQAHKRKPNLAMGGLTSLPHEMK